MSAAAIEPGGSPRNDGPAPLVAWIDRSWGSGPGTHGGYLAALGLAAMRARLVGELGEDRPVRALATHFLAPVADRPLARHAVVERVGRDAAVCSVRAEQGGALVLVGSATFGASRSGPDHNGSCAPTVLGPDDSWPSSPGSWRSGPLPRPGRWPAASGPSWSPGCGSGTTVRSTPRPRRC
jgi:hypothetical protein